MIRVALIGSGYIADCHISAFHSDAVKEIGEIVAVVGHPGSGMKAAAKVGNGCRFFETLEEAEKEVGFDAVDITTPTFLHEEYTVKAANMGKHVFCEKPLALSVESFDRMYDACKKNNVKFMAAQVLRYMSNFTKIADTIKSGVLGNIHMYSAKRLSQHPTWATWHRDPSKSGGGLYDINVHDIDLIYSMFGMPESVYAVGWKSPSGCWNHVATSLKWADKQAICESSLEMTGDYPFTAEIIATGDNGSIDFISKAGANIKGDRTVSSRFYPVGGEGEDFEAPDNDGFADEIRVFLEAVINNTEPPVRPEESRDVLNIIVAAEKSLETGEVVKL